MRVGVCLDELNPVIERIAVLVVVGKRVQKVVVVYYARDVHPQVGVCVKELAYDLGEILYLHVAADAHVSPYDFAGWVMVERTFQLIAIANVLVVLLRYVVVDEDRQVLCGSEVKHLEECGVVDVCWLAVRECRKLVVAAHELAYAAPKIGVQTQKLPNVFSSVAVIAIDATAKREETLANFLRLCKQLLGYDEVGSRVVVATAVIREVFAG